MHREIIYYVNIMYDSLWENIRSIHLSEPFVVTLRSPARFNAVKDILYIRCNVTRMCFSDACRVLFLAIRKKRARLYRVTSNCTAIEFLAQVVVTHTERSALYYIKR